MKRLDELNAALDAHMVKWHLKKKSPSHFELRLSTFIQSLILNLNSGLTLDQALKMTIVHLDNAETLIKELNIRKSAVLALHYYAISLSSDRVWRLTRLIEQSHRTGSNHLLLALEKYNDELWKEKMDIIRKKSETVSVQLTFLLMLSLISVIVVVIAPVVLTL